MDGSTDNPLKNTLKNINAYFREKNKQPVFAAEQVRLKIERSNGLAKNFMRLCNKTMIGLNRTQVSWGKLLAGFMGMGLGWLCSEVQEGIGELRLNYRPTIKTALIEHVLHSQQIKDTLNRSLLQNVYTNKDVQYSMHQVLYWKAIRPQMDDLLHLSKQALISALREPSILDNLKTLTSQAITANSAPISEATLDFLGGQLLTSIVIGQIAAFFRTEIFYELLASEIRGNVCGQLGRAQNREGLYKFTRENFLNW